MVNWFVRSLATGTGAGTSWTNATTTISAAITLSTAGDTFFVADDHAETIASALVLTFKGGNTAPDTILCADHTIASPGSGDLKLTGSVTTTGASGLQIKGAFYCYGLTFSCGTGSTAATMFLNNSGGSTAQFYDNCKFVLGTTATSSNIVPGNSTWGRIRWINTTVQFGNASQLINPNAGSFEWLYTASAIAGATLPTTLMGGTATGQQGVKFEGLDLSALGSGKNLFSVPALAMNCLVKECKLGSAATIVTGSFTTWSNRVDLIRCDSGNTNYRNESYQLTGSQITETTIVRTGGATDGTTSFSHKAVSNTNATKMQAYELLPIAIWNDTVGSAKTITVECIASAVLNNDECWMEVEYMGDASFPTGSRASTYKTNILATGAANTTSTATWGGALTGKFKMAVTITPQQKGPITVYVKVAKASATVYIDPFITVT
jgi:hypothetical protein